MFKKGFLGGFAVLVVLFMVMGASTIQADIVILPSEKALPGAEFDRFPLELGKLSAAKQADLGLHPMRLQSTWCGLNWMGKRQTFEFQCLDAGTIVLADKYNIVRYKEDCGNRLVTVPNQMGAPCRDCYVECMNCEGPGMLSRPHISPVPLAPIKADVDWDDMFRPIATLIGWLILGLLALAAIAGALVLLILFILWLGRVAARANSPATPQPVPVVPPQPPAPQEHRGGTHVVTRGQRAGEETRVTFRGFDAVNVSRPDGTVNARFETGGNDIVVTG